MVPMSITAIQATVCQNAWCWDSGGQGLSPDQHRRSAGIPLM